VIKKTLNPKYNASDATFDFLISPNDLTFKGAFVDCVVWDKDLIGKGELAVGPTIIVIALTLPDFRLRRSD
jgi:phosphatidylserine decarboxylase